ncbi:venom protease isoform X2 [Arctopsyche grandis]|uniref:venom protease isoform X2 n=1 Tax=Arctopsyche grandis TaxID=121162 RepID=UPI00406D7417
MLKRLICCSLLALLSSFPLMNGQEDRCNTPDGRVGVCYNIRRCESLLNMLKNLRSSTGALSYLRESVCGYDGADPIVCCPDPFEQQVTTAPVKPTYSLPTLDDNCGINNGSFAKRVIGGVPAALGAWPWIGALGYRSQRNPGTTLWQCGGTLITRRHVLTAAHCIHGHENDLYLVRLGELDLESDTDGATPIDVPIEMQLKHQEYNSNQYSNDIGVLKLSYDVPLTPLIWPICLPTSPELRANSFERNMPFIAGWGALSFQGPTASRLQELQIPVVTNDECKQAYTRFKSQVIDQRVLCAGYAKGGKDACQGDSGGPLMWPSFPPERDNIYFYLIGVVSYGYKCAEAGYPGVYTRVTEFIPWIESQLNV